LVHVFVDEPISSALVAKIKRKEIFVVPTLAIEESFVDASGGAELAADPDLAPYLTADEIAYLHTSPGLLTPENLDTAKANVAALREAGVRLLAGTDSPIHGAFIHRDLEMLTLAGLSPRQALIAGTSAAADAFGLSDRGRIAPGLRADLLLVDGNPLQDIKATRRIRHIWKTGVEVERPLPSLFGAANRSTKSSLSPVCGHGH
jgi:imidazolonepropionase-like amidohydrolase